MNDRRKFLHQLMIMGLLPLYFPGVAGCKNENSIVQKARKLGFSIDQFGIQLWTVRDFMENNPLETLRTLGTFGYKQIESYQGEKGIFWGLTPQNYKNFLAENDMVCISSHCDNNYVMDISREDEFRALADDSASTGIEYLIIPWMGNLKTIDAFKLAAENFNRLGNIAKQAGVKFAYHNHSYSFRKIDGQFPQSILMDETDEDLMKFEMDIYWVVNANQDPIKWLTNYPNRFTLCHVKDKYADSKIISLEGDPNSDDNYSCVLGTGEIDFDKILPIAKKNGMEKWIVEQERYDGISSLNAAEKNAEYMEQFLG